MSYSAARVLLLGAPAASGRTFSQDSYRGLFRLLTEQHIPFAVSDNLEWIGKREFDLVVAADWAPAALQPYVQAGGSVLIASARVPEFEIAPVAGALGDVKGYLRIRDRAAFPSLADTDLLMLNGPFTAVQSDGPPSLTLVPPSLIGPPEFVHIDMKDTATPGIAERRIGKGNAIWLPWDLGGLYYRQSLPAHAALFRDLLHRLQPQPQLRTGAHPLVEIALMRQNGRTLLHLINLSGHSQTGYFPPVPMEQIRIEVAGAFTKAQSIRTPASLPVKTVAGYATFTLPHLRDYELVVLQ